MTVIMGSRYLSRYVLGSAVVVGGADQIFIYLVGFYQRQLLY